MNSYSMNELYDFAPDVEPGSFERLNPLTTHGSLLESELIDVRVSAQRSRAGIIFDLRSSLYFAGPTTALVVLIGTGNISWDNDGYRRCRPWGARYSDWEPITAAEEYTLEIPGIMSGPLTVSAIRAEMYVGTVEELDGRAPPNMGEEPDAAIIAGFPQWSSVMTVNEHYRYPESEPPRYTCLVCGYPSLDDLPVIGRGAVSCPSCGFQFGHTDTNLHNTYEQWRELWVNQGMPWTSSDTPPPTGWAPTQQLAKVTPVPPGRYICLVCGYPDLTNPYGDFFHPSYEICPCCGYQYGYDDHFRSPISWRTMWIDHDSMRWWAHGGPPESWEPHQQLKQLEALPRDGQVNGVKLNPRLARF
jgi:hypothetical protein